MYYLEIIKGYQNHVSSKMVTNHNLKHNLLFVLKQLLNEFFYHTALERK